MRVRTSRVLAAVALIGLVYGGVGCGADDPADMPDGPGSHSPPAIMGGSGGSGGSVPGSGLPPASNAGVGGTAVPAGSGGQAGMGMAGMGMAGSAGMIGAAGMAGGASPADLSGVTLEAIGANGTVGLDWTRVPGADGYRVYWSMTPGVTPMNGQMLESTEPSLVQRGLTNGTPYYYVVVALSGGNAGQPSAEATATPHGQWALEQLGSGDFDDVVTGERVAKIPIAKRVHILLFAEGYTEAELKTFHDPATHVGSGMASNDVDRWVNEIFGLDPYNRFKEAFVVWFLPRASANHAGMGDTAFDVTVSGGAVTGMENVAAPLWDSIDGAGDDAFLYPYPGATGGQQLNYVAAFLVLDPQRMRAGMSGITTFGLRHPTMQGVSIPAAFGIGHAHEFTHAFGRVSDEYMETSSNAPQRTSETSNVVASNACSTLPWAHLLEGAGINTTPGLVGAFGTPELGYHSELLCLMNGTHDNGSVWCQMGDEQYTTLTLRPQRFCNFCREMVSFHVFERTGVLSGMTAFDTWKSMYRKPFYDRFGFNVPAGAIPQTLQCNRNGPQLPVYEMCM
jgi:hypothetical protein